MSDEAFDELIDALRDFVLHNAEDMSYMTVIGHDRKQALIAALKNVLKHKEDER
jgi:hypothetical protein